MTAETRPRAHERVFWRRLAHLGATRGPAWWVRFSPPVFGWAAAALVPSARKAVRRNLHRIRGDAPLVRDTREVLATFGTYASCLAEALSNDAPSGPPPVRARIHGELWVRRALAANKGAVLVTIHSAGWETAGPLLCKHLGLELVIAMEAEPDARAMRVSDHARAVGGVSVAHVGADPFSSLPLLHHLRDGGVVALQLDRAAAGMRTRAVRLLGEPFAIPEGPLRLAQASGAPLLPVFCARTGFRSYLIEAHPSLALARHLPDAELDRVAQALADRIGAFLKAHPTQWFHFR